MTKAALIREIARLQGKAANLPHLRRLPVSRLQEMHARWRAIAGVTQREIR